MRELILLLSMVFWLQAKEAPKTPTFSVSVDAKSEILTHLLVMSRLQNDYNSCSMQVLQIPQKFQQEQAQVDQLKAKYIAEAKLGGEPADWDIDVEKWLFVKKPKPTESAEKKK